MTPVKKCLSGKGNGRWDGYFRLISFCLSDKIMVMTLWLSCRCYFLGILLTEVVCTKQNKQTKKTTRDRERERKKSVIIEFPWLWSSQCKHKSINK